MDAPRLDTLMDDAPGTALPLPPSLAAAYGTLAFPQPPERPWVVANFVSTLDGVTSLDLPGRPDGRILSGESAADAMVMGLLRACADAVVVGGGTFEATPRNTVWTAGRAFPPAAADYQALRAALGKTDPPLNVVVTQSGDIDLDRGLFHSTEVPSLILTSPDGARRVREHDLGPRVRTCALRGPGRFAARAILNSVLTVIPCRFVLIEGGPHLMAGMLDEHCVDELFLTLAPQVAGREHPSRRMGLVAGRELLPERPLWGCLSSVKRAGAHLFLRYAFQTRSLTVDRGPWTR